MTTQRFLAFDLGASGGRAIVGNLEGGKITLDEIHRFPNGDVNINGHMYWPILGIFRDIKAGLSAYAAKYGPDVTAIGIDTWGVDFGLLDKNGQLLANPYHYRDSRTEGMEERISRIIPRKDLYARMGIQTAFFNTLLQLYSMVEAKSPLLDAAETMLFVPDLLNYFLTGEKISEFSIASTSQMYSCADGEWATDVLEKLGIPTRILPQVMAPGTVVGKLLESVATETGMHAVPVVAPGEHDTASAVAAVPVLPGETNWCYLSSGTWSLMGLELPEPILTSEAREANFTNEGGVDNTIRFLKNIMGMWLIQQCRAAWLRAGEDLSWPVMEQMASEAKPFLAFIDPNDESFKAPTSMPDAIVAFCKKTGQAVPQTKGEILRIASESLALAYRDAVENMEAISRTKIETIHIVGGGSKHMLLNQMTADATGRRVVTGPSEATALGNIMMQAIAMGVVGSISEARQYIRNSVELGEVLPEDQDAWHDAYDRYKMICGGK